MMVEPIDGQLIALSFSFPFLSYPFPDIFFRFLHFSLTVPSEGKGLFVSATKGKNCKQDIEKTFDK